MTSLFAVAAAIAVLGWPTSALPSRTTSPCDSSWRSLHAFVNPQSLVSTIGGRLANKLRICPMLRSKAGFAQIKLSKGEAEADEVDAKEKALRALAAADKPPSPPNQPQSKEEPSIVDQLMGWINSDEVGAARRSGIVATGG